MQTFPVCPCCNNEKMIPVDGCNGRRHERKVCDICNGNGIVSMKTYLDYLDKLGETALECDSKDK